MKAKRLVALLICAVLMLQLVSVSAFAAQINVGANTNYSKTHYVKIGGLAGSQMGYLYLQIDTKSDTVLNGWLIGVSFLTTANRLVTAASVHSSVLEITT